MAKKSDVGKVREIFWKTEKATVSRYRCSSIFGLFDAMWKLHMEFASGNNTTTMYKIYLHRTGNRKPKTQFSVITSVLDARSSKNNIIYENIGRKTDVIEDSTVLYQFFESNHCPGITGVLDSTLTVSCIFIAMPEILNETVEVTTQTDFDRPLPVKNRHDLKFSSDANLDSLSVDLCKLLEDKVIPDIKLRCGDRTVAAHKAILAARSSVFSAMFQSKMSESETGVIDITDVDADVLEMFLKYVYSGRLSNFSDEGLPSLYTAGDKYDVSALKKVCSERMISNLSRENCLNILLLSDAHSDPDFKSAIFDFILNQIEILKSEEWKKLCKDNSALSTEVLQLVVERKCF